MILIISNQMIASSYNTRRRQQCK